MERMIQDLTGIEEPKTQKEKEEQFRCFANAYKEDRPFCMFAV
jgi:hypothetical protein